MDLNPEIHSPPISDCLQQDIDTCSSEENEESNFQSSSVSEKIDADICPNCHDVFYTSRDLFEHVLETYHVLSGSSCSKFLNKSDTNCPICPDDTFQEELAEKLVTAGCGMVNGRCGTGKSHLIKL